MFFVKFIAQTYILRFKYITFFCCINKAHFHIAKHIFYAFEKQIIELKHYNIRDVGAMILSFDFHIMHSSISVILNPQFFIHKNLF